MNSAQINACQRPTISLGNFSLSHHRVLKPSTLAFHGGLVPWTSLKLSSSGAPRGLNSMPLLKARRSGPVCLSKTGGDNEVWLFLDLVYGSLKPLSLTGLA